MFFIYTASWILVPHVVSLPYEADRLFTYIGLGLFVAGVMYLVYLAIEPFVRRAWPTMLVGWSRALAGRLRDAVVGRDLIVGTASGLLLTCLTQAHLLATRLVGWAEPVPMTPSVGILEHSRYFLLMITNSINNGLQNALLSVMVFAMLREFVRRTAARVKFRWVPADYVAASVALVLMALVNIGISGSERDHLGLLLAYQLASVGVFLLILLRFGLLATFVMFTTNILTERMPLTLQSDSLYSGPAWLMLGLILGVAGLGLWMARGDEPVFGTLAEV